MFRRLTLFAIITTVLATLLGCGKTNARQLERDNHRWRTGEPEISSSGPEWAKRIEQAQRACTWAYENKNDLPTDVRIRLRACRELNGDLGNLKDRGLEWIYSEFRQAGGFTIVMACAVAAGCSLSGNAVQEAPQPAGSEIEMIRSLDDRCEGCLRAPR